MDEALGLPDPTLEEDEEQEEEDKRPGKLLARSIRRSGGCNIRAQVEGLATFTMQAHKGRGLQPSVSYARDKWARHSSLILFLTR